MHKHEKTTAAPVKPVVVLDPKSLMGNPARSCISPGKPSATLLNLDEAFARVPAVPTAFVPVYPEGALQLDQAKILVNEQAELDFDGPFKCVVNFKASNNGKEPGDDTLNAIAVDEGVSFHYRGKDYLNSGPWTPVAP